MSRTGMGTVRYHRSARLGPALLVALPLSVLLAVCVPYVPGWLGVVGVGLAGGLPLAAAQVVRDHGWRLEPALFAAWGGRPSERMLRWRDAPSAAGRATVCRRHALVARHLGIVLPDADTEAADPDHADGLYAIATAALRERTRDESQFPILLAENITYGFRRNALACRPIGVGVAVLAAAGAVAVGGSTLVPLGAPVVIGLTLFDAVAVCGWWLLCTPDSVRRAADTYARQLLACLEAIDAEHPAGPYRIAASTVGGPVAERTDRSTRDLTPQRLSRDENLTIHHGPVTGPAVPVLRDAGVTPVLFLAADPTDASRLRLGEELREIHEKLRLAQFRDRFKLHQRFSVRPTDVSQALLDVRPRVVHFAGHGNQRGELCLEDLTGAMKPVAPDALAALFGQFRDEVVCVLLNACYSALQAQAIVRHVEYVVGMDRAIGDPAAIAFAIGFYQALGAGRDVPEAFELGRVLIRMHGIPEHLTPVLLRRAAS